ncbi:TPA: YdgA family protein [Candidatus Bathyarchaeota archaeon]|nr:YdgA family protein [Candidatus Bathyarchaeota archaeon]
MKKTLIVIPAVIVILVAIAAGYYFLSQQAQPSQEGPYGPPSGEATTVKYKTASFTDSQGIGTKAFTMLIPSDWQAEGTIRWALDNPAMPAYGEFRAWNPNGHEEFHFFENQAFISSDNPLFQQTFPPSSRYMGALVHDLLGPIDALKEIALPKFRSNVENLRIVSEERLPQVAKSFQTGTDPATGVVTSAEAGKIRIEYTLNGVAMEEELYCIIQTQDIPIPTIYGTYRNINWYMTYTESFRAEKGKLDPQSKTFQTISYFARTDVNWLNKYNQVVEYLIQQQIQQIQSLGQISSIASQTSNDVSDANFQAWQRDQDIKDQLANDFSNSILGIQSYRNPVDGSTVDLPSGYSSVWANSLGEYVLSDSPSYNPNLESNLNWQQMSP